MPHALLCPLSLPASASLTHCPEALPNATPNTTTQTAWGMITFTHAFQNASLFRASHTAERLPPHLRATGAAPEMAGPGKARRELFLRRHRSLKTKPAPASSPHAGHGSPRSGVSATSRFHRHAAAGEAAGTGTARAAALVPGNGHCAHRRDPSATAVPMGLMPSRPHRRRAPKAASPPHWGLRRPQRG